MRVHELAKELGLTNKEAVDLCLVMGIDVKSHSSSIIEAQADRVRRRAERDGLVRDEQPEEPKPEKKAAAAPGGGIDTMPIGDYVCELPGDANGPAGRRASNEDFTVVNSSSYRSKGAMGSYLLTGDRLAMTSGPHRGKRYHRVSNGFLRLIGADGQDGTLRCVKRKRNNT